MILNLTGKEIFEFQYILPAQGSLKTLELVQKILDKVNIQDIENDKDIDFTKEEIDFVSQMIQLLDENQSLKITSLSLIKKILKESNNG